MEAARRLAFRSGLADTIVDMISMRRKDWIKEKFLGPIGLSATSVGVREAWKIDREYYRKKKIKTIFDYSKNPLIIAMPSFKPSSAEHARIHACRMQYKGG